MAQPIDRTKVKVTQRMIMHMALANAHQGKYEYTLIIDGHPLNGLKIIHETYTKKSKTGNFGKQENMYYLNEMDSKIYDDIWKLIEDENDKIPIENNEDKKPLVKLKVKK